LEEPGGSALEGTLTDEKEKNKKLILLINTTMIEEGSWPKSSDHY